MGAGGHLQIGAAQGRTLGVMDTTPIGHNETGKAPLLAQHLLVEPGVVRTIYTIHLTVGTHHGINLPHLDRHAEGGEI